jgi:Na+-driven multidrug efflux pump
MGVGGAAAVMVGKKIGEGNKDIAWTYSKRFIKLAISLGTIIGIILNVQPV